MPLDRFVLILVCVIAAAAATVFVAATLGDTLLSSWPGLPLLSVAALVAYVVVRRIRR